MNDRELELSTRDTWRSREEDTQTPSEASQARPASGCRLSACRLRYAEVVVKSGDVLNDEIAGIDPEPESWYESASGLDDVAYRVSTRLRRNTRASRVAPRRRSCSRGANYEKSAGDQYQRADSGKATHHPTGLAQLPPEEIPLVPLNGAGRDSPTGFTALTRYLMHVDGGVRV